MKHSQQPPKKMRHLTCNSRISEPTIGVKLLPLGWGNRRFRKEGYGEVLREIRRISTSDTAYHTSRYGVSLPKARRRAHTPARTRAHARTYARTHPHVPAYTPARTCVRACPCARMCLRAHLKIKDRANLPVSRNIPIALY